MMNNIIALGFTGNYVDRVRIRDYFSALSRRGYPLTFFHPLRVIEYKSMSDYQGSGNEFVAKLVADNVLLSDVRNFKKRFDLFASSLSEDSYIRVVVHTEYNAPFWCSEVFRNAYLSVLPGILEYVQKVSSKKGFYVEPIVEIHPGFINVKECRIKNGRIYCGEVERDYTSLAECLSSFREELREKTDVELRFCIEPRAGGIIWGKNKVEPQTISTHKEAYLFAKYNNLGLVIDPGQTILKRMSTDDVWREIFEVASIDPNIIEEIHIHSFTARKGRGHGIPTASELKRFKELIDLSIKNRTKILGVVLEILMASSEKLLHIANEILKDMT